MTTAQSFNPRDRAQTDLIRFFDQVLIVPGVVDRFAIETKARRERAAMMGEMIGGGLAWLWRRATHLGDTKSPPTRFHVESRVQF